MSSKGRRLSGVVKAPEAETIRVICRFRPPKSSEIEKYGQSNKLENFTVDEVRNTVETSDTCDKKSFTFDKVNDIYTRFCLKV